MEGSSVFFVLKNTVGRFNAAMGLYYLHSSSGEMCETFINQ